MGPPHWLILHQRLRSLGTEADHDAFLPCAFSRVPISSARLLGVCVPLAGHTMTILDECIAVLQRSYQTSSFPVHVHGLVRSSANSSREPERRLGRAGRARQVEHPWDGVSDGCPSVPNTPPTASIPRATPVPLPSLRSVHSPVVLVIRQHLGLTDPAD